LICGEFEISGIAKRIVASGYGVYALDHPGFGLSEGLHGYIPSFDELADNVIEQYTKIKGSIIILSCDGYKVIVIISCFSIWYT